MDFRLRQDPFLPLTLARYPKGVKRLLPRMELVILTIPSATGLGLHVVDLAVLDGAAALILLAVDPEAATATVEATEGLGLPLIARPADPEASPTLTGPPALDRSNPSKSEPSPRNR